MSGGEFSNPNPKVYRVKSKQGKWRIWWATAEYQASWNAPGWNSVSIVQTLSGSGWRWGFWRRMAEAAAYDDIRADREDWDKVQKINKREHDTFKVSASKETR